MDFIKRGKLFSDVMVNSSANVVKSLLLCVCVCVFCWVFLCIDINVIFISGFRVLCQTKRFNSINNTTTIITTTNNNMELLVEN